MLMKIENLYPFSYVFGVNRDVNMSVLSRIHGEFETKTINKMMEPESVSSIEWVWVKVRV